MKRGPHEIKLGEILKAMKKNKGGGDPSLPPVRRKNRCQPLTYKEIGMDKKLASEAQTLASLPRESQEQIIDHHRQCHLNAGDSDLGLLKARAGVSIGSESRRALQRPTNAFPARWIGNL